MAWANSAIFQQAMLNPIARGVAGTTGFPTTYGASGLLGDLVNVALYNNTTAPDKTAAVASTGFATGTWSGNEVTDATNWTSGGRPALNKTWAIDTGSSSVCFHADNTTGAGNVTISGAFGCLVYDNAITAGTVAKQGMCFNFFGGTQSVTAGTFTIIWATVGATTAIFNITV